MSALTKSWLQKQITELESTRDEIPFGLDEDGNNTLAALKMALAGMESEPVAYMYKDKLHADARFSLYTRFGNWSQEDINEYEITEIPLYTAPQPLTTSERAELENYRNAQQVVPSDGAIFEAAIDACRESDSIDEHAWNHGVLAVMSAFSNCRAAMLQGADGKPELTVSYGPMPESNGKTNWTAILHRKGEGMLDGITIDRSEYPGRVLYAADRARYLIGEKPDRPFILEYDADKHSGYVAPGKAGGNSPVIQDGWVMVPEEPTHEMLEAGDEQFGTYDVYRRMIAAAPQQEVK